MKTCAFATPQRSPGTRRGVALVIILAFVVLLSGLIIAFFSRAMSERQISNSSASQTKVELFAQGAVEQIIGDLEQEILAGSGTASPPTGVTIFTPKTQATGMPATVMPALVASTGTNGLENLLKISRTGLPFYSNVSGANFDVTTYPGPNRAANLPTTGTSQNGRFMTAARWNTGLLLPVDPIKSGSGDYTPLLTSGSFTPPDWVLVARDGSNPVQTSITTPNNLTWSGTASSTVVGRYAYAIYHEGGLLDVNVAGYPSVKGVAYPYTTGTTPIYKGGSSFADLAQIGLSGTQITNLVGWRNYVTAKATGSLPPSGSGFTFTSGSNFAAYALSNTTGFLRTGNSTLVGTQSDRMFSSRQEMIKFMESEVGLSGTSLSALQYLTHFSRSLEQPSFVPDPLRPPIVGTIPLPSAAAVTTYQGNNTYCGGGDSINLTGTGFLSVRVLSPFTRLNGTQAVVGEPLVKTKFALSNLAKVTTSGTASVSGTDQIYARFGLSRSSATQPWLYNHGASNILKLTNVALLNREPDFAELLKAAINAGSVGKAGPSGQGGDYQYVMDVSGDLQILQIVANLIDQQKTDNYPTRIQYVDTNGATRNVYGTQDLPYFYRWHYLSVTTQVPNPLLSASDKVTILSGSTTYKLNHAMVQGATLLQPGSASYLIIPQIWNPHDANTPSIASGPTTFRVVAETNDPTGAGAWGITAQPTDSGGNFDGGTVTTGTVSGGIAGPGPSAARILNSGNATLQFSFGSTASAATAFREPTLLWKNGFPTGMTLTGTSRTQDPSLSGTNFTNTYFGILVGDTPVSWVATFGGTNCICQTSTIRRGPTQPGTNANITDNITFRMQYQDASSNWITYQEAYAEDNLRNIPGHTLFVNAADYSGVTKPNYHKNPLMIGVNASGPALTAPMGGPYDPRSNRFSTAITGRLDQDDSTLNGNPTLDAITMVANGPPSSAQNLTTGTTNFVLMATQRPSTSRGQFNDYLTPCRNAPNAPMGWYSSTSTTTGVKVGTDVNFFDGLLSQNNPAVKLLGGNSTVQREYYADPDGVCRRAMGAYVPVSGTASGFGTNTTSATGLPMATAGTSFTAGVASPSAQSRSRPMLLHRAFQSVAEMSYAFRGTPWKNIDFFTPESGDTALLDVFCVNEPPADAMVAGKVNLNTRQLPVLKAIFAGAYRDAWSILPFPPVSGVLPALDPAETQNLANTFVGITSGTQAWQGPLTNIADLVGHYVFPPPASVTGTDVYQYTSPSTGTTYTYAGFSAALSGSNIWTSTNNNNTYSQNIQRFRESPIRPLVNCGQTRVWNLMIDVVAQTGRYPSIASSLAQFLVEGEKRYWVHLAIDRATGVIIDKQVEVVTE